MKGLAGKMVGTTLGAAAVATGIVRHVAWYLSYHIGGGDARVDESRRRGR